MKANVFEKYYRTARRNAKLISAYVDEQGEKNNKYLHEDAAMIFDWLKCAGVDDESELADDLFMLLDSAHYHGAQIGFKFGMSLVSECGEGGAE